MGFNTIVSRILFSSKLLKTIHNRYYACLCGHLEIVQYLLDNGEGNGCVVMLLNFLIYISFLFI
jgi:hypothetical protein